MTTLAEFLRARTVTAPRCLLGLHRWLRNPWPLTADDDQALLDGIPVVRHWRRTCAKCGREVGK